MGANKPSEYKFEITYVQTNNNKKKKHFYCLNHIQESMWILINSNFYKNSR